MDSSSTGAPGPDKRAWLLPTLRGARSSLSADLVAGLTLAAIGLPGSMAAAQLVGVSPALGLLAFVVGAFTFLLFGGHRILSVGPDSSIAPMLAAGAAGHALATGAGEEKVDPGALLLISLMVGAILIVIGLCRGGWITQFLSRPVTAGLLAGVGLNIIASQLHIVLGINEPTSGSVPVQVLDVLDSLDEINLWAVILALVVLAISGGAARLSPRFPGPLLGLAVVALITAFGGLRERGVETLPSAESVWRLPDFGAVPWGQASEMLVPALVIVVLVTVQTGATEAATKQGQATLDRDLGAIGVASVVAAGAGAFALNASPPRTRLVQQARGRSQVSSLMAGSMVLLVLFFGTGLLPLLPVAALSAVLMQIAFSLIRFDQLRHIARFSKAELGIALGTIVLVAVLGIVPGVGIAAVVTLLDRTRREARPPVYRKGLIPQSNHWVPVDAGVETVQVPEVLVWSVEAPIWYADADYVIQKLHEELDAGDYSVVVLDGAAVSDLDYTGVIALGTLIDHMLDEGLSVLVARATRTTQEALARAGLLEKVKLHPTVSDAVKEGAEIAGLEDEFRAARAKKKDLARLAEDGMDQAELLEGVDDPTEDLDVPPEGETSRQEEHHREQRADP
ncbi:putative sulfate transporter [Corynebacterium occultum]|uniref:Putative sulfate transporter n=1 Tax=Corynebacterium occultum TaxID=2675219 RepID=A0A6B8W9L9_9CORY|nr:SulP family inorganic anion transporter [Corynebacterium occultum]QGU08667.1 putative sulfate transporter [Corynebacterium occultum]